MRVLGWRSHEKSMEWTAVGLLKCPQAVQCSLYSSAFGKHGLLSVSLGFPILKMFYMQMLSRRATTVNLVSQEHFWEIALKLYTRGRMHISAGIYFGRSHSEWDFRGSCCRQALEATADSRSLNWTNQLDEKSPFHKSKRKKKHSAQWWHQVGQHCGTPWPYTSFSRSLVEWA